MTYAIAKCYANNSDSDNNNDIMKMIKIFHVDKQTNKQTRVRLNLIKKNAVS